jgi:hypothetical protein
MRVVDGILAAALFVLVLALSLLFSPAFARMTKINGLTGEEQPPVIVILVLLVAAASRLATHALGFG